MHLNKGMEAAICAAKEAFECDEVPVGAALLDQNGNIVAVERNRVIELKDPTAHAEMLVLKKGFSLIKEPYLEGYTLCVTLEPCAMCAQAISYARVDTLCFGAYDVKSGGVKNGARVLDYAHFKPYIYDGIMEENCSNLLKEFFKQKR
jgi:tRNA(Arg) A34 adenosine deaminase TadA